MKTTPIRKTEEIEYMKQYFIERKEYRNYALFVVGINTALRISDLLNLKWKDVYKNNSFKEHIYVIEQKTNKLSCIALNKSCCLALQLHKKNCDFNLQGYIFSSNGNTNHPISRNRAYHIIKLAAAENKVEGNISCHSLRKTFGYHAWKQGTPPVLLMNIYNHSSYEVTKRYLSIDQDEKDGVYKSINL